MIRVLEYLIAFKQEIVCFTTFFWNKMKKKEFLELIISSFAYCRQETHSIGRYVSGFCFCAIFFTFSNDQYESPLFTQSFFFIIPSTQLISV